MRSILIAALLLAPPLSAQNTFTPEVPDVEVVTHEGKTVRFYSDLVKGRTVAVNFVFTNCSTICPASGATFANLQKQSARGVHFISVSIDPTNDTPKKLAAWSQRFRTEPGWTLVTGKPAAIDRIVKAFGASNARPQDHQPLTIIGNDASRLWTRFYGLPGSDKLDALVDSVTPRQAATGLHQAGQKYFANLDLVDQNGRPVHFYSDLLAGKIVVIQSFFASCKGSCPVMSGTFRKIQTALGDRIGRDVHLISITVDPETDTPERLLEFAKAASARPGWHFLTGDRKNVEAALHKLGLLTPSKETHTAVVLIGNEPKGVWKKAFGLAASEQVVQLVQEVVAAE